LLESKIAVVTGAGRGQGRAHALKMASHGAHIVAIDCPEPIGWLGYATGDAKDLAETAESVRACGQEALIFEVDVRDAEGLRTAMNDAVGTFGHIDYVVANAGIGPRAHKFWEIPEIEWSDTIDINLTGVWRTVAAAVPAMIESARSGAVVVTSSAASLRGASNLAAYNAAKVGLVGLVQTMARELAEFSIRVNAIAPTMVATPMIMNEANYRLFRPDLAEPSAEDVMPAMQRLNLLPEPWAQAEDVSNAVVFLCSDLARCITGTTLPVDLGGVLK
jgi:(+)-trans-carveol dehydrogenase/(-)-trans-carveol dehydrogenase